MMKTSMHICALQTEVMHDNLHARLVLNTFNKRFVSIQLHVSGAKLLEEEEEEEEEEDFA